MRQSFRLVQKSKLPGGELFRQDNFIIFYVPDTQISLGKVNFHIKILTRSNTCLKKRTLPTGSIPICSFRFFRFNLQSRFFIENFYQQNGKYSGLAQFHFPSIGNPNHFPSYLDLIRLSYLISKVLQARK